MYRLSSSLRGRDPFETFHTASRYCKRLGISRITETTRLDRIGIPVAVSIRPKAQRGSLIVTAGKGFHPIEAKIGALMEAIEFAFSEVTNSCLEYHQMPTSSVLSSAPKVHSILDLCPKLDAHFNLDTPMTVVKMHDVLNKQDDFIPAELAFIPFVSPINEPVYFGSHSNGLASGNTYEEALIHAIYEVIERDILSFEFIRQRAVRLEMDGLPENAVRMLELVRDAGLEMVIKTVPNSFSLPFFKAYVIEKYAGNPSGLNAGYGVHGNAGIALIRAMSEAVQSRMSYIHGGREDLTQGYKAFANRTGNHLLNFEKEYAAITASNGAIRFDEVMVPSVTESSISDHLNWLLNRITSSHGIQQIFVGRHTHENEDIQVVKVVIPGLEFYNTETNRVGPRLRDFLKAQVS